MREKDLKDFSSFLKEFQSETDRGAALVGAALIDQKMADTLCSFMIDGDVSRSLVNGGMAPLGTLSARIKTAYSLGLIDKHEFEECEIIRKIRNEFAHGVHGTTFEKEKISALCNKLKSDLPGGREAFLKNMRGIFINSALCNRRCLTRSATPPESGGKSLVWGFVAEALSRSSIDLCGDAVNI